MLKKWDELPEFMKTEEVRPYYDYLKKKKMSLAVKRIFDIAASLILLILLSPVILILSIWIKLDSKGPVVFRQKRVTQYGREFFIYKFRTMVADAEQRGTQVTVKNDDRITKVGKKLRKCRLDEILQLLNILKGDMTFVGTRPESVKYVAAYTNEMKATLLLPAGVTSVASIQYKDEERLLDGVADIDTTYIKVILPEKMKYNLEEIYKFNVWHEFKVMIQTVCAVLH